MYDYVLLKNTLIVTAPCDECDIISAELTELLQCLREVNTLGKPFSIKTGDLFDLIVHSLEIHRLYINGKFLCRLHVLIQPDSADLDDLTSEMDGQFIENGGLGAHCLIPF